MAASWETDDTLGGGGSQGFSDWMRQIAQGGLDRDTERANQQYALSQSNPDADQNIVPVAGDLNHFYQELGEGKQGQTLLNMYNSGLQVDDINKAYSGANLPPTTYHQGSYGEQVQDTTASPGGPVTGQPLFNHGIQNDLDQGAFWFDPQRGFQTKASNTNKSNPYTDMIPSLVGMAVAAGMGGAIGMVDPEMLGGGGGMFGEGFEGMDPTTLMSTGKTAQGMDDGSFNPLGLAGSAAGAFGGDLGMSLPPSVQQFLGPAMQIAQGKGLNPIQVALQLARQGGR